MGKVTLLLVSGSTSHMVMDCAACAGSELERGRTITNIECPSLEYGRIKRKWKSATRRAFPDAMAWKD